MIRIPDNGGWDPVVASAEERRRRRALDAGFLSRVFKTSIGVGVFVVWFLVALGRNREAASFLIGAAISLAMLWSARYTVHNALTKQKARRRVLAVLLALTKYGLAGVIVWRVTRWPDASLPFFAFGAGLTQMVLFLKALGQVMAPGREPLNWERLIRSRH